MNPLTTIPPRFRKTVYAAYAWLGLASAATEVGYHAAGAGQPTWLTVELAVFAFVGMSLGLTAAANTPTPVAGRRRKTEAGAVRLDVGFILAVALAIVVGWAIVQLLTWLVA